MSSYKRNKRVEKLENTLQPDDPAKITCIDFFIPGEPVQQFGKTFEDMDECLAYCDDEGIEYRQETGPHGAHSYFFPTAENVDDSNPMNFKINQ